jgi:hypothetical protein
MPTEAELAALARIDAMAATARNVLFDLFADSSVPVSELRCRLALLAELIRWQLQVLDGTWPA